jgi:hypothetical protein
MKGREMSYIPKKRDPSVGLINGHFATSDDVAERREGLLMLLEHNLVSFGEQLSMLECENLLHDEPEIRKCMQGLYDQFMKEYEVYPVEINDKGWVEFKPV